MAQTKAQRSEAAKKAAATRKRNATKKVRQTARDGGGGMLAGLLAPLSLPERVIDALDSLVDAVQELGPMRLELTRVREQTESLAELMPAVERLIKQTEPLSELLPALESLKKELREELQQLRELIVALEGDESHLNVTAGKLVDELLAMHKTLAGLQDDVQSVTERLPDPSKGPLQKAQDALTGGAANPSS